MSELVKAIEQLNATMRRQNHILMEANNIDSYQPTEPDERLKQKETES